MQKQGAHPSGRVVSVRLPDRVVERLDVLSQRTGRTRGFYLKMAIASALPVLEEHHWEQVASVFEERSIENEFHRIMLAAGLLQDEDNG